MPGRIEPTTTMGIFRTQNRIGDAGSYLDQMIIQVRKPSGS
jgi:hypothetical protein